MDPKSTPKLNLESTLNWSQKWTPKLIPTWPQNGPQIAPKFWGQGGILGGFPLNYGVRTEFWGLSPPIVGSGWFLGGGRRPFGVRVPPPPTHLMAELWAAGLQMEEGGIWG